VIDLILDISSTPYLVNVLFDWVAGIRFSLVASIPFLIYRSKHLIPPRGMSVIKITFRQRIQLVD